MTPAEIAASVKLTPASLDRISLTPRTLAERLVAAVALPDAEERARAIAAVIRRCRSIVAPRDTAGPTVDGRRTVELHVLRAGGYTDVGGVALVTIPARHLDGEPYPTPRDLALTIAGLLA